MHRLALSDSRKRVDEVANELTHYTSLKALEGILNSNCLWATSFRFLNDSTEVFQLQNHLESTMASHIDQHIRRRRKYVSGWEQPIARHGGIHQLSQVIGHSLVKQHYENMINGKGPHQIVYFEPFITSFCAHYGDMDYERENGLLSQWRAYAQDQGVAIVFDHK